MTDIKERLRAVAETVLQPGSKMPSWMAHTAQDAHAEIERLESAIVMRKAAFEAVKDDSIAFASENVSLRAERDALQASNERMEAALRRARDDMEGWGAYAAPNFREKWDLDGDLAAIDEALTLSTQPVETDEERDERRADVIDPEAAIRRTLFGQVEPWDIALSKARAIAESDKARKS